MTRLDIAALTAHTAHTAQFDRDGFLVLEGFLDAEAAAALGAELDRRVASGETLNKGAGKSAYEKHRETVVDVYIATDLPLCQQVFHHPEIMALTSAICGERWRWAGEPAIFETPAPGGKQGWHQDTSDPGAGQFFCNRIAFPRTVSEDQGALYLVPGSHKQGDIPPGGNHEPIDGEVEVRPSAGTVVFMHSRCFHRVGPNTGTTPRTQVNLRARPETAEADLGRRPLFRTGTWDFAKQG